MAWQAARLAVAAFAQSHGVYTSNYLSLILDDGEVLTLNAGLVNRHITARGVGLSQSTTCWLLPDTTTQKPDCSQSDLVSLYFLS